MTGTTAPQWLEDVLATPGQAGTVPSSNGVLRFVDDEGYAESFGKEWNWFATTQLDRAGRDAESREAFFSKTGWSPEELAGATVLDAGCGMGRFADVACEHAARVVGVDLSRAVDAAQANLADRDNTAIIQANLFDLPFRGEAFDRIYSLGVLHHTPDTRRAFMSLIPHLKKGGKIAIWVYADEPGRPHRMSDLYRRWTTRMSNDRLLRLCRMAHPLGRLYRTRYGRHLYPVLPVAAHRKKEWRVLDTFDWYAPRYQWKHTWEEVEGWFHEAGLVNVRRNGMAVAVSGEKA